MSRIVHRVIIIPQEVTVNLQPISESKKQQIYASGPYGKDFLDIPISLMSIFKEDNKIITRSVNENYIAITGTYNSLIRNLITGVLEGHQQRIIMEGAGYQCQLGTNNNLKISSGKSHADYITIFNDVELLLENNKQILIKGTNKQRVMLLAARIRRLRLPSPYRKKGIYYFGEKIVIKGTKSSRKK